MTPSSSEMPSFSSPSPSLAGGFADLQSCRRCAVDQHLLLYVAPEYANTGLLKEKSNVYSFGVLLLEAVTGRDLVDYSRPANEVNLVEWIKMMVGDRRAEEVVDPFLEVKPSTRALKRALLVAPRCVDPNADKRPKMGRVVRMLEAEEVPLREDRRHRRSHIGSMEIEPLKESATSSDMENNEGTSESQIARRS